MRTGQLTHTWPGTSRMAKKSVAVPTIEQLTESGDVRAIDVAAIAFRLHEIEPAVPNDRAVSAAIAGVPRVPVDPIAVQLERFEQQFLEGQRVDLAQVREPLRHQLDRADLRKDAPRLVLFVLVATCANARPQDDRGDQEREDGERGAE